MRPNVQPTNSEPRPLSTPTFQPKWRPGRSRRRGHRVAPDISCAGGRGGACARSVTLVSSNLAASSLSFPVHILANRTLRDVIASKELFGGDPKALGATIRVDGNRLLVIGVAPPGFDYPDHCVLWKPAAFSRGNNGWVTIARLKPGISWAQARAAFAVEVAPRLPKPAKTESPDLAPQLLSLQDGLLGPVKNATVLLLGTVLLVLLIAWTNVANLHPVLDCSIEGPQESQKRLLLLRRELERV